MEEKELQNTPVTENKETKEENNTQTAVSFDAPEQPQRRKRVRIADATAGAPERRYAGPSEYSSRFSADNEHRGPIPPRRTPYDRYGQNRYNNSPDTHYERPNYNNYSREQRPGYERPTNNYERPTNSYERPTNSYEQPRYSYRERYEQKEYQENRYPSYERRSYNDRNEYNNYTNTRPYYPGREERYYDNNQARNNYRDRYNNRNYYQQNNESRPFYPNNNNDGYPGYQPDRGYRPNNRYPSNRNNNRPMPGRRFDNFAGGKNRPPHKPKKFIPRPKPIVYENVFYAPDEPIRLNKFLANSGVCSRRLADEKILAGEVTVNGNVITELGVKVTLNDKITVNGKDVNLEQKVYVLLNKPRKCVTTTDDPQERFTVMNLVKNACPQRLFPVGRLDRNTTGVLLLTNDGDLASKLVHPSFKKKKIYHVWLDRDVTVEDMQKLADGVDLEDGEMHADAVSYVSDDNHSQVGIEIHSGRNRIVRRLFSTLGYHVRKLDRVYFAGLTKKNLGRGKWRFLTQEEVNMLKMGAFE